jgi:hypothetical protein
VAGAPVAVPGVQSKWRKTTYHGDDEQQEVAIWTRKEKSVLSVVLTGMMSRGK